MSQPKTLKEAAGKYWKDFLPAWFVPVLMMADTIRKDILGTEPSPLIINAIFAYFFLSFFWWARLYLAKRIRQSHATILGMLAPFTIWGILVAVRLLVLRVSGAQ